MDGGIYELITQEDSVQEIKKTLDELQLEAVKTGSFRELAEALKDRNGGRHQPNRIMGRKMPENKSELTLKKNFRKN